jgi:hypothetical protein
MIPRVHPKRFAMPGKAQCALSYHAPRLEVYFIRRPLERQAFSLLMPREIGSITMGTLDSEGIPWITINDLKH